MILVDSHLHFDTFADSGAVPDILARAKQAGVQRLIAVGGSDEANALAARLAREHSPDLRAVLGYDRDLAASSWDPTLVDQALEQPGVAGVGETGLDYHYEPETADHQQRLFSDMLALARSHQLPTVVHSRDAEEDTLRHLAAHASSWQGDPERLGVLHCFTGSASFASALVDLGYYISFSGIVTFKNADALRAVACRVPAHRLLIETDAPYLAPVPYRGRQNEPAFVVEVARVLAELRGASVEEIAACTTANACRLFGWPDAVPGS